MRSWNQSKRRAQLVAYRREEFEIGPRPLNPSPVAPRTRTMPETHPLTRQLAARLAAHADRPASVLVVDEIWTAVVEGSLSSGERLPTVRQLAVGLGVSPSTIEKAYRELEERGIVAIRPGEGTFVSLASPSEAERERHRSFAAVCWEAVDRARALGFSVDDLIDALAEFRSIETSDPD